MPEITDYAGFKLKIEEDLGLGLYITSKTDLRSLIEKYGDFFVGLKDHNHCRYTIPASFFEMLSKNKDLSDILRGLREVYVPVSQKTASSIDDVSNLPLRWMLEGLQSFKPELFSLQNICEATT